MKQQWTQWLARIDALSLRERVFLLLSLLACLLALTDLLWLTPAQAAYKQLTQRFVAQSAELERLRGELRASVATVDPAQAVRDDIERAQAQLAALDAQTQALLPQTHNGPALEQTLAQLLRREDGLTLIGVRTITPDAGAAAPAPAGAPALPGLSQRGLELRVAGSYPALAGYVKALETAMPALRWGPMTLTGDKQPPELTLQVFVLGVQP